MKRFSSKHDAICHIREMMGDQAEHEDAELMFNALHDGDLITPDHFGWIMEEIGDTEWFQLLREVAA